jgi:hypothetical protein
MRRIVQIKNNGKVKKARVRYKDSAGWGAQHRRQSGSDPTDDAVIIDECDGND